MLKNEKLDSRQIDEGMVEIGDIIYYHKSEDDKRKGIISAQVKVKRGSDYVVIPCDGT